MRCLLCQGKSDQEVCHTCSKFLRDRYDEDYERYLKLLREELGGQKNVEKTDTKTKEKRRGGGRRK